jgi:hypothetical protein
MRSSSASTDDAYAVTPVVRVGFAPAALLRLSLAILSLAGCASGPPPLTPSEVQAELIGVVMISGEHPYERQLVLADTTGTYWLIQSPEFEGELLELGGQSISARGIARTEATGYRSLLLRWYDLHPAPGRISGVGTLERWGDDIVLVSPREGRPEEGQRVLIIDGPLRRVLETHVGYRAWVMGDSDVQIEQPQENGGSSARITLVRIVVMEYGVLGPPIPSREASPRSTLPDSSNR